MAAGVKPVAILHPEDVTIEMRAAIEAGRIVHIGDYNAVDAGGKSLTAQVFAQADKVADGQELFARYFHNGEGYKALPPEQFGERIGQLLGYTENDIALFKTIESTHPVVKWLMDQTSGIRCAARKESMLLKNDM